MTLLDKKILFIAPQFYNYHNDIIQYFEYEGAKVTFYAEDIYTPWYRFLNRIGSTYASDIKSQYLKKIIETCKHNDYDIVFTIRAGILTEDSLEIMRKLLNNAQFVMYQWDSNEQSNYRNKIKYFHSVKTFDKKDALEYNLEYLPLFYSKYYEDILKDDEIKEYDLVFYGSYHSDRLKIIKNIDKLFIDNNLKFKYHLYITKMALFRFMISGKIKINDLKYLKTYSVDNSIILDDYKKATTVLDIELNIQNGLTMRTFEALGSGLNLITTNKSIQNESFYNESNIMIIDRNKINIDLNFFNNNNHRVDITNYSFKNWIREVFN